MNIIIAMVVIIANVPMEASLEEINLGEKGLLLLKEILEWGEGIILLIILTDYNSLSFFFLIFFICLSLSLLRILFPYFFFISLTLNSTKLKNTHSRDS